MKTYARIESGVVAELVTTSQDIRALYAPLLHWVDVTAQPPQVGWVQGTSGAFSAAPVVAAAMPGATLAGLQAQLAQLTTEIAALQAASKPQTAS